VTKEQKFYNKLRDIFIGAKVEGKGGFINLMRIKSNYYNKIEALLKEDIDKALKKYPSFREELFDKLYSFFNRYFTESGSIYFNSTPFHNNIYEKIYTDDKDVMLFWKTKMLYYVKTDRIFRSIPVEFDGKKFYFDASTIENKKTNEKRELIYELKEIKNDNTIMFHVIYSEKGRVTNTDEILKAIRKKGITNIKEEDIERAFRVFEKQSKVDFFINKNAKAFLQEQFKLWAYQYFWDGAKDWSPDRINQLQILKDIAYKLIDFISQFEDELVKIWNKPKFVRNSNYVISLDRIANKNGWYIIERLQNQKGWQEQIKEWIELGMIEEEPNELIEENLIGKKLNEEYQFLPVDTKYFKDLEIEILELFDNLDDELDGWLIKSENYQALNTVLPKFRGKIQMIFIDPPFNKAESEQFLYIANYLNSSWITLLENRLKIAKEFLSETGTIFVNSDDKCNSYIKFLLDEIFDYFQNEIIWAYEKPSAELNKFKNNHSNIYFYSKNDKFIFNTLYIPRKGEKELTKRKGKFDVNYEGKISSDWWTDIWTEVPSFATAMTAGERAVKMLGIQFPTQLPEKLLYRIIHVATNEKDYVMDFFAGTGVTGAVAHKMRRKWVIIEAGEHFYSIILPRMKKVLAFDSFGISKENGIKDNYNENKAGGFFKYYELEQYEETLANTVYKEDNTLFFNEKNIYEQYIFMRDEKMLKTLKIDYKSNKINVNLNKLYPNIDIAETLSNITGKFIKKITNNEIEYEDGTKIDINNLDYKIFKPLFYW